MIKIHMLFGTCGLLHQMKHTSKKNVIFFSLWHAVITNSYCLIQHWIHNATDDSLPVFITDKNMRTFHIQNTSQFIKTFLNLPETRVCVLNFFANSYHDNVMPWERFHIIDLSGGIQLSPVDYHRKESVKFSLDVCSVVSRKSSFHWCVMPWRQGDSFTNMI